MKSQTAKDTSHLTWADAGESFQTSGSESGMGESPPVSWQQLPQCICEQSPEGGWWHGVGWICGALVFGLNQKD